MKSKYEMMSTAPIKIFLFACISPETKSVLNWEILFNSSIKGMLIVKNKDTIMSQLNSVKNTKAKEIKTNPTFWVPLVYIDGIYNKDDAYRIISMWSSQRLRGIDNHMAWATVMYEKSRDILNNNNKNKLEFYVIKHQLADLCVLVKDNIAELIDKHDKFYLKY